MVVQLVDKDTHAIYHGKRVRHKRTGAIRKIWVLENDDTPSGNATKKGYNSLDWILYDTYVSNNMFFELLD